MCEAAWRHVTRQACASGGRRRSRRGAEDVGCAFCWPGGLSWRISEADFCFCYLRKLLVDGYFLGMVETKKGVHWKALHYP